MSDILTDPTRMSGGEIEGPHKEAYDTLRRLILDEPDVHHLHALAPLDETRPEEEWLYFIETPFATFPRYVIGQTDPANADPDILFQSGTEWSARCHWDHLISQIR